MFKLKPSVLRAIQERNEKDQKYIKLHEDYITIPGWQPVTAKFYAKHENVSLKNIPEDLYKIAQRGYSTTPKEMYTFPPPAVNMEYGWFLDPFVKHTDDPSLKTGRKCNEFIKIELAIKHAHKQLPEKKSVKEPFRF